MAVMDTASDHPYAALGPETVLDALESIGLRVDGRLLALNSYENRVYQVGLEDEAPVVAKFYRPARWTDDAILEEHAFTEALARQEIPVVAPLVLNGGTLHRFAGFRFSVSPRRGGRAPELDNPDVLEWIGRFMGRIHAEGQSRRFRHRPVLDIERFGEEPGRFLLDGGWIPAELVEAYESVLGHAIEAVRRCFDRAGAVRSLRLHGDCHAGNILWTDEGPHFVDFDDCLSGPAVQDLWMLLSGDPEEMGRQFGRVLKGYRMFEQFDAREIHLVEALRTLRLIHYSAWLARRWEDPAFPAAFPWFNTQRYWQDHILELREQLALMDEPPFAAD